MLRTAKQSTGRKKIWQLNASYTVGRNPIGSSIVAIGRIEACPNTKQPNLGANEQTPKPRLAGSSWKFKIIPIDANGDCNQVYFQLTGKSKYTGKYVAHSTECNNQGAFTWATGSGSNTLKWKLKRV